MRSAPHGAFEILAGHLASQGPHDCSRDRDDSPALKVIRVEPQERLLPARSTANVDSVTLTSWKDEHPTDFELTATARNEDLDLLLSGHRHYHLFWWRVQYEIIDEEVVIHGPFLADNTSS